MPELDQRFDEIRSYYDHEVNDVLRRLTTKPSFFLLMSYLFPEMGQEEIVRTIHGINSTREFQKELIYRAIMGVLKDSSDGLTIEGFDRIDPDKAHLFISNHRDIILDSAILNVTLFERGHDTTHIAIGNNLMVSPLVTDLMKLNKSFVVHRDIPRHQLFPYSERLSAYIRAVIRNGDSVWMAQKSGRTKDGDDRTHTGLMKMLNITGEHDIKENFRELNIIPMAISYEYEPCDHLKTEELVHNKLGLSYEKDDKLSMIKGIRDQKGRIHMAFGKPVCQDLEQLDPIQNRNEWIREFCLMIDRQMHQLYRLWPGNYIAADWLKNQEIHKEHYSPAQKEAFTDYIHQRIEGLEGGRENLLQQILEIYAIPVFNREQLSVK